MLGVGFVAGTFVLTDTMNKAFSDLFTQVSSGSDIIVRAEAAFTPSQLGPGGGGGDERKPVPESVLSTVEGVPGVSDAAGSVTGYAQMIDPATGDAIGGVGPPTLGVNWSDSPTSPLSLRQGQPPAGPTDVAVDAATATKFDLSVGDTIKILLQGPPQEFTISGTLGFGEADNLAGATLAAFDTATAQKVLDKEGEFDQIDVVAAAGTSVADLRSSIQSVLPKGVEAVKSSDVADEQAKQLQEALGFFRTALLVFAFIALFVGAFIIFNTFSIIVAQRTREMALLRAIGASRRQVMTSVVVEAFVTGLDRVGAGPPRGHRDRHRPQGTAVRLRDRSAEHLAPARAAHHRRRVRGGHGRHGRLVDLPRPPGGARGTDAGAPRIGGQRQRLASAPADHRAHPHRGGRRRALVRAVRQRVERRLPDRTGCRGDVRRHRDPVAAGRAAARGGDRGADPPPGDPREVGP